MSYINCTKCILIAFVHSIIIVKERYDIRLMAIIIYCKKFCSKCQNIHSTNGVLLFLILPPKSGLRLLSYCCKRLFSRNVTFWTVWTLRVAFILEEMVVGASKDLTEPPPDPFVFRGGGTDHFSFALLLGKTLALVKWPFWVFGITAMPLLDIKCELRSYANAVSKSLILLYFHHMINHLFVKNGKSFAF